MPETNQTQTTETTQPEFTATTAAAFDDAAAQAFLADGFCRVDEAIDDDELARLREIYDWCFSEAAEGQINGKALGGVDEQGRQMLPQVFKPNNVFPELRQTRYYQRMKEIAGTVFQEEVQERGSHMILKPAGYGIATPWHQDQAYHDPSQVYRNINFWLPLDGATVEGGCMQYVAGSHRGPIVPHEYLDPNDPQTALVAQDQNYWSLNATAVPCPARSCTLHHSYMMHYAGPNQTDTPRRGYIVVFRCAPVPARRPWRFPWKERWQ